MTNLILVWKDQIEAARKRFDDEYETCLTDRSRDRSIGMRLAYEYVALESGVNRPRA